MTHQWPCRLCCQASGPLTGCSSYNVTVCLAAHTLTSWIMGGARHEDSAHNQRKLQTQCEEVTAVVLQQLIPDVPVYDI